MPVSITWGGVTVIQKSGVSLNRFDASGCDLSAIYVKLMTLKVSLIG